MPKVKYDPDFLPSDSDVSESEEPKKKTVQIIKGRTRNLNPVLRGSRLNVPPLTHIKKPKNYKAKIPKPADHDTPNTYYLIPDAFGEFNNALNDLEEVFTVEHNKYGEFKPNESVGRIDTVLARLITDFVYRKYIPFGECMLSRLQTNTHARARVPIARMPEAVLRQMRENGIQWKNNVQKPGVSVTWLVCWLYEILPQTEENGETIRSDPTQTLLHYTCKNVGCLNPKHLVWKKVKN